LKRLKISFSFLAMLCFLTWLNWKLCFVFLLSVAVHECGHLLVMKIWRIPIEEIAIGMDGVKIRSGVMGGGVEICCALAGPLSGLILAIFTMRLYPQIAVISTMLSIVNMLPIYPLDGGRILQAILCMYVNDNSVRRIINTVTWVVCSFLMLLSCWLAIVLQAGLWPIAVTLVLLCRVSNRE